MPLRIVIEPPKAGWIVVRADLGERELVMSATYIGEDCLRALSDAALAFEESGVAQAVDLVEEPRLHRLSWAVRGDGAALTIGASRTGKPADLVDVARVETATRLELTLVFWRALRKLSPEFPPMPNREWPYPFPAEAVRLLSVAVARHKHTAT